MERMDTLTWLNGAGYNREEAIEQFEITYASPVALMQMAESWMEEAREQNEIELTDALDFLRETQTIARERLAK